MMRLLHKLGSNERGASVVEMALAAPIFAALIIGMSDLANAFSMKLQLEQAAQRGIERVEQLQTVQSDYSFVGTEADAAATAAGFSGSTVTVNYRLECNGIITAQSTGSALSPNTCSSGQTYARYVTVTVSNKYTPLFISSYFPNHDANGQVTVSGYAGVRVQ
jgi:Flp pilus assembly protein TadG